MGLSLSLSPLFLVFHLSRHKKGRWKPDPIHSTLYTLSPFYHSSSHLFLCLFLSPFCLTFSLFLSFCLFMSLFISFCLCLLSVSLFVSLCLSFSLFISLFFL